MIYIFTTKVKRQEVHFDRYYRDDLTARNVAKANKAVIKVETEKGRVVYRKPMTDAEMAMVLKKPRAGTPLNNDGDLTARFDRKKA